MSMYRELTVDARLRHNSYNIVLVCNLKMFIISNNIIIMYIRNTKDPRTMHHKDQQLLSSVRLGLYLVKLQDTGHY